MKAKLVMLMACLCLVFSAGTLKAQSCQNFSVDNSIACPFNYRVTWDCGERPVLIYSSAAPAMQSAMSNPGTYPSCCTILLVEVYDPCSGQWVTMTGSTSICDCDGNTVTVTLITSGSNIVGMQF